MDATEEERVRSVPTVLGCRLEETPEDLDKSLSKSPRETLYRTSLLLSETVLEPDASLGPRSSLVDTEKPVNE